jgi:cytosine/adenosine deaminase-related metal-dependent hydrolase
MISYITARYLIQGAHSIIENGFMAVEGATITEVGRIQDLPSSVQNQLEGHPAHYDLITPGFINTHAHLELTYPYSIPVEEGESMGDWLYKVFCNRQKPYCINGQALSSEDALLHRIEAGIQQMLNSGVTTINDISQQGESLPLLAKNSVRGIVSLEFFHPNTEAFTPETLEPTIDRYLALQDEFKPHSNLKVGLSPHALYNVSPMAWKHVIQTCKPPLVHTHLAESQDEMAWLFHQATESNTINLLHQAVLKQTFRSPLQTQPLSTQTLIAQMTALGLFEHPTLLAHGVYLNESDLNTLKQDRLPVSLAHCPQSNLWLQKDTLSSELWQPPFCIPVGLGTDSQLSVTSLDIRHDAQLVRGRFKLSVLETLDMLTLQGARALFMEDTLGTLLPGKQADWLGWKVSQNLKASRSLMESLDACLKPGQKPSAIHIAGKTLK